VSWWRAESNAVDSVSTNHGGLAGSPGFAPGWVGTAYSFDGINDSVYVPAAGVAGVTNNFTMEMWVFPTAGRGVTVEAASGTSGLKGSGQRYAVFPAHGDSLFAAGHSGAGISVGTNGVSVFEHGNFYIPSLLVFDTPIVGWTHVAVAYSNALPMLYLNGQLVRTGLQSSRIVHPSMEHGGGAYGYYEGLMDEYSIYSHALTQQEIAAIYAAASAGKCEPGSRLSIRLENGQVVIEWPFPCDGCVLEESDQLGASEVWTMSDAEAQTDDELYRVIFPLSLGPKFYRLNMAQP